jgi:hypothetical protein
LPQRRLEVDRPAVLAEEIGEGFVSEFLEVPHAVFGKQVEGVPGFLVELDTLAGHRDILLGDKSRGTLAVPKEADEPVIQGMVTARPNRFIEPCIPTRAAKPPAGPDWVHENQTRRLPSDRPP